MKTSTATVRAMDSALKNDQYTLQQYQRQEDNHSRDGRANHCSHQFANTAIDGVAAGFRLSPAQVPLDILNYHHRVVDDQTDGPAMPPKAHQIESLADNRMKKECDYTVAGSWCGDNC